MECVVNVSEGRDDRVVAAIAAAAGRCLLDVHTDPHHHRAVLTLAGPGLEEAVRSVAREAVGRIDLRRHDGVHPRLGAVDVVPFVPLPGTGDRLDGGDGSAIAMRDRFAAWLAGELGVPCFSYGPDRSLPEVRRRAFADLAPDVGPATPHPTAGATCAGARPVLVAWNVWLAAPASLEAARAVARAVRGGGIRALGMQVGDRVQVSCNLIDPLSVGPAEAWDRIEAAAAACTPAVELDGAELVGLVPEAVLVATPAERRALLDLSPATTIEARLREAGLDGEVVGRGGDRAVVGTPDPPGAAG